MPSYIAIQNTYNIFEMALFLNDICVDHIQEDKRHTSKLFIPLLEKLLTQNSIKITNLDFCAVNCGPGPFSTLRSIIASVNGLHAAINIPLIGIDGLEATFLELYDPQYENTVVLLNAFNQEVYYLIAHKSQIVAKGYQKIDLLLNHIQFSPLPFDTPLRGTQGERLDSSSSHPECFLSSKNVSKDQNERIDNKRQTKAKSINFIGNGTTLYHNLIKEKIGNNAIIKENSPEMCSVKMIGALGVEKWCHNQEGIRQPDDTSSKALATEEALAKTGLMPLYLKKHAVEL